MTLMEFAINGTPGDAEGEPVSTEDLNAGVDVGTVALGTSTTVTLTVRVDELPESPDPASFTTQAANTTAAAVAVIQSRSTARASAAATRPSSGIWNSV